MELNEISLENYSNLLEQQFDTVAMEGFNADANDKFKAAKKQYKEALKQAKSYAKSGEPDKCSAQMDVAKKALQDSRNEIASLSGGDTVSSAIIGNLIAYAKWVGTNLLVMLAAIGGGTVGVAAGVGISAATGAGAAAIASGAASGAKAVTAVANITVIVNNIKTIIQGLVSLAKAYDQKKGKGEKMSPNDFNMFYRGILDALDSMIKQIDKVKSGLVGKANKKKAKLAAKTATEAALAGDLVTCAEALVAMIAYESGDTYTPQGDAGLAVESAIECAMFEDQLMEATV